jgi:hypothetical protein
LNPVAPVVGSVASRCQCLAGIRFQSRGLVSLGGISARDHYIGNRGRHRRGTQEPGAVHVWRAPDSETATQRQAWLVAAILANPSYTPADRCGTGRRLTATESPLGCYSNRPAEPVVSYTWRSTMVLLASRALLNSALAHLRHK